MKSLFLFLVAGSIAAAIGCGSQDKTAIGTDEKKQRDSIALADTTTYTALQWIDSTHQTLGKVKEGQVVNVTWRFKNVGSTPLVITRVSAGCGCTASEPPKEPIAPGQEGKIEAQFDTKGQTGTPTKSVAVTANTKEREYQLYFSAEVTKD